MAEALVSIRPSLGGPPLLAAQLEKQMHLGLGSTYVCPKQSCILIGSLVKLLGIPILFGQELPYRSLEI